MEFFRVYRISHIRSVAVVEGLVMRLVHPCLETRAFSAEDAIEYAANTLCWSVGGGSKSLPGAFLMAGSAAESIPSAKIRMGHETSWQVAE